MEWYEYNREMLEKYNKTDNKQPTTTIVENTITTTTTKKLKKEPKEPRENNNTNSHNSHHHTNNNSHHTNSHNHHHHHNHQHHHSHNHVNNSHHTNDDSSHNYNHTNSTDIDSKTVAANENCHIRKEEEESPSFDDEYILTNFYPEEEDSLERLFYGEAFLKQRRELDAVRKKSSVVKTTANSERRVKEASVKSGEKAETINERFVRMHRVKDVATAAAKKSSRSRYDDQSLSDDEPLFKIGKHSLSKEVYYNGYYLYYFFLKIKQKILEIL